jgi:hypothetical protein
VAWRDLRRARWPGRRARVFGEVWQREQSASEGRTARNEAGEWVRARAGAQKELGRGQSDIAEDPGDGRKCALAGPRWVRGGRSLQGRPTTQRERRGA